MNVYLDGAEKLKKKANEDTVKKNNPYLSLQTGASQLPAPVPSEPAPVNQMQVADNTGTVMSSGSTYEKVRKMQEDAYKAYSNMINQQTEASTARIGRQKKAISDSYNDAYKQLSMDKEANLRKLPEQMAKLGLYGSGSGETAVANITADYSNQLKSLMKAKNDAIYDIDGQIEAIKEQGAAQIAQYYSELMRSQPDLFLGMLDREFANKQYADELEYRDKVFEYNKANDLYARTFNEKRYADELEYRDKMFEYNKANDLYARAFNEKQYADELEYRYQNTPKAGGGGGGVDKTSKYMNMVKADADALNWLFSLKGLNGETFMYEGWNSNTNPLYAAKDKLKNKEAVAFLKANLVLNGFDPSDADKKINEYKKVVATEIASAEGQGKTVDDVIERYKWLK